MRQLVERLAEYGKRCARTAESGLQAAPRRELERTHEFNAVVRAAAQACPRYASAISRVDSTGLGPADLLDCRNHVSAFLERSGFYRDCPVPAEGATRFADSLAAEASRQTCNITNLVLLDGLELSAKEVVFSAGRLVELDDKMLRRFVDGNAIPGPIASQSLKPGFPICLPEMAPLYTRRPPSARNSCSSQHRPASEAVSSARGDVRSTGGPVFPAFLRHRSTRGPFLRQSDCVACAARQPAGTGSAQIRRNMSPNSRRVRCPSASRSQ